jgi:hypothetical protein
MEGTAPREVTGLPPTRVLATGIFDVTCALGFDGLVRCWGSAWESGLGRGLSPGVDDPVPAPIDRVGPARDLIGTYSGFVVIDLSGAMHFWGHTPLSTIRPLTRPVPVVDGVSFSSFDHAANNNGMACTRTAGAGTVCHNLYDLAWRSDGEVRPVDHLRIFSGLRMP